MSTDESEDAEVTCKCRGACLCRLKSSLRRLHQPLPPSPGATPQPGSVISARCPYCRNNPGLDIRGGVVTDCPDCNGTSRVEAGSRAYREGVEAGLILRVVVPDRDPEASP